MGPLWCPRHSNRQRPQHSFKWIIELKMTSGSNGTNKILLLLFVTRNVDDIRAPIPQTQGILVEPYQGRVIKFVIIIILCAVQDLALMIDIVDFDFELPSTLPHSAPLYPTQSFSQVNWIWHE